MWLIKCQSNLDLQEFYLNGCLIYFERGGEFGIVGGGSYCFAKYIL